MSSMITKQARLITYSTLNYDNRDFSCVLYMNILWNITPSYTQTNHLGSCHPTCSARQLSWPVQLLYLFLNEHVWDMMNNVWLLYLAHLALTILLQMVQDMWKCFALRYFIFVRSYAYKSTGLSVYLFLSGLPICYCIYYSLLELLLGLKKKKIISTLLLCSVSVTYYIKLFWYICGNLL